MKDINIIFKWIFIFLPILDQAILSQYTHIDDS